MNAAAPSALPPRRDCRAAPNGRPFLFPRRHDSVCRPDCLSENKCRMATALQPPLQPGDRAIDFARRDSDGRPFHFYERLCGRPTVLVLGAAPDDALAASLDQLGEAAVALVQGTVDAAAAFASRTKAIVLADEDGAVTAAFLGPSPSPTAIVLSPTFHIAAILPIADHGRDMADAVAGLGTAPASRVVGGAPVLIVPDVLDRGLCAALMDAHETQGNVASGMPRLVDGKPALVEDPSAKVRRDHTITDPALGEAVTSRLTRRLLPEIAKAFCFQATRFEALKVVCYDAETGGYFRPHRDNTTPDAAHRRFAMTLNLNTGQYEGGELRFPEYGPELYAPPAGGAVVFSCAHLHEATDVTAGRRFVLLTFLYGEEEARRRAAYLARARS